VLWAATLDAVVDGEQPVAELVTLVLTALPVESEVVIIEDVLRATRKGTDLRERCEEGITSMLAALRGSYNSPDRNVLMGHEGSAARAEDGWRTSEVRAPETCRADGGGRNAGCAPGNVRAT